VNPFDQYDMMGFDESYGLTMVIAIESERVLGLSLGRVAILAPERQMMRTTRTI
jgi:hypothetical protein